MGNRDPARLVDEASGEPFEPRSPSRSSKAVWLPAGLSAVLLLCIAAAFFGLSQRIEAHRSLLDEVLMPTDELVLGVETSFLDELATWRSYQIRPTPETLEHLRELDEQTRLSLAELSTNEARIEPGFLVDVDALRASLDAWRALPVAVMSGRMSLDEFRPLQPDHQGLSSDVMAAASRLRAGLSQQMRPEAAERQRLERTRVRILASFFPLTLLGIVLTAWLARRATSIQRRLLENWRQEALVRDAMAALTGAQVLPAALNRIAVNAMRIAGAEGAYIEQSDDARRTVDIVAGVGVGAPAGSRVPFVCSITHDIVRTGANQLTPDLAAHHDDPTCPPVAGGQRRFGFAVPLPHGGDVDGALVLLRRDGPIRLRGEVVSRLQALGAWAALALRRQRLAAELAVEHARLKAVIEEMPLGVVLAEAPSGQVALFNRQALDMWGSPSTPPRSIDEFGHWELFHPDGHEYETTHRPLARSILTGETVRGEEAEIRRPGGQARSVRVNSAPIRDPSGAIVAGVATVDDISEEKRREREARFLDEVSRQLASTLEYDATMEAILELLVPRLADAAAIHHLEGHSIVRKWGEAVDPVMRQHFQELDRDPLPLRSAHPVAVAIRTGKPQLREVVHDDLLKAVTTKAMPFPWLRSLGIRSAMAVPLVVRGKPIGALLLLSMKRARRYTCEDLELADEVGRRVALGIDNAYLFRTMNRAEQRSRFLADASNTLSASLEEEDLLRRVTGLSVPALADFSMAYLWDQLGLARFVASAHRDPSRNAMLEEIARLSPPDPSNLQSQTTVGRALRTAQPILVERMTTGFLDGLGLEPRARELVERLAPTSWITVPLVARDKTLGAIVFASASSGRMYGAEDLDFAKRFAHSAALAVQNARLLRTVQDAVEMREEVLAIVSHDLRNPLHTIGMSAHLLHELALDEAEQKSQLELILRSSERMTRLIQDLLEVMRLESGHPLVIERKRERPAAFIQDACESFVLQAREKKLRFGWTAPDGLPDVLVDVDRIVQVLSNLIGNAIKFTPEGGSIEVQAVRDQDSLQVSVKDSGRGMPPDDVAQVFRPFWQAATGARLGAGLGLPISRGIIEQHGGRIWVESREGAGSTFFFTLPIAQATELAA